MSVTQLRASLRILLVLAASTPLATTAKAEDAEAGKTVFNRQCAVCHSVQAGQNKVGPSLAGVFGRAAGMASGFNYSPAMREAKRDWDAAALDAYLVDPRASVTGTRMVFTGLKDAQQRSDVIAYLQTLH